MELRVCLRRREPIFRENVRMIEIDRRVAAPARRIDIDHFEIFADRSRSKLDLPRNGNGRLVHAEHQRIGLQAGIVGEDAQPTHGRHRDRRTGCMLKMRRVDGAAARDRLRHARDGSAAQGFAEGPRYRRQREQFIDQTRLRPRIVAGKQARLQARSPA